MEQLKEKPKNLETFVAKPREGITVERKVSAPPIDLTNVAKRRNRCP